MCAEFTPGPQMDVEKLLLAAFYIKKIIDKDFNFRVYPRDKAPIIFKNKSGQYEVNEAEFSLIPEWWNPEKAEKKTKSGRPIFATHNARFESIEQKPAFRDAFRHRHCLIPITNFFESSLFGSRFPGNRIKVDCGGTMLAAGCYSDWVNKVTGEIVSSFTILTHIPNKTLFEAGHDRMPIFLNREAGLQWLENEGEDPMLLKDFLLNHNVRNQWVPNIEIDRPLKEGWQKNAPEPEELLLLERQVRA